MKNEWTLYSYKNPKTRILHYRIINDEEIVTKELDINSVPYQLYAEISHGTYTEMAKLIN